MTDISSSTPQDIKISRVFTRTPSSWDPQDDLLLRHLKEQQKLGWKEIASHFTHRTPNACQFRWRRLRSGSLKTTGSNTSTASSTPGATVAVSTPDTSENQSITNSVPSQDTKILPSSLSAPASSIKNLKALIPQQVRSNSVSGTSSGKLASQANNMSNLSHQKWSFNNDIQREKLDKDSPDPLSTSLSSSSSASSDDEEIDSKAIFSAQQWTPEEDELLLTRRQRELSFTELSIILSLRTEVQIKSRINELEQQSKSTSAISSESPLATPIKPQNRHSHPHPLHLSSTTSTLIPFENSLSQTVQKLNRSYSNSSQTSITSSSSFLNQDSLRSKSFSMTSPYPLVIPERYASRKNSLSFPSIPIQGSKQRSNSMKISTSLGHSASPGLNSLRRLRAGSFSFYNSELLSDDEDSSIHYNTSNIRVEPIKNSLPQIGTLFNDYYTKS